MAFNIADLFATIQVRGGPAAQAALGNLRRGLLSTDSAMSGLAARATGLGASILAGLGAYKATQAAIQGMTTAVSNASAFEQYEQSMGVMLKSTTLAKEKLRELAAFAERTPFQLPQLVKASQQLLTYGFNAQELLPMLRSIGDAASASPDGMEFAVERISRALGQMKAKTTAAGQEMLQLTEAGIPAWDFLAAKIGTDVPTAMKKVEDRAISADTAIKAILEGIDKRFGGMMAKQATTLAGLWSTMSDSIDAASRKVGEGMIPPLKETIKLVTDIADAFKESLNAGDVEAYSGIWIQFARDYGSELQKNLEILGKTLDTLGLIDAFKTGDDLVSEQFGKMAGKKANALTGINAELEKPQMPRERKRLLDQAIKLNEERAEFLRKEVESTPLRFVDATGTRTARDVAADAADRPLSLIKDEIARLKAHRDELMPLLNQPDIKVPKVVSNGGAGFWEQVGFGGGAAAKAAASSSSKKKGVLDVLADGLGLTKDVDKEQAKHPLQPLGVRENTAIMAEALGRVAEIQYERMAKPEFMGASEYFRKMQIEALSKTNPLDKEMLIAQQKAKDAAENIAKILGKNQLVWVNP